ncbi:MAG: response regulator [Candidatus Latescibacteria bacterium]|nr:response regulator [Candidatus Latescibacterota bacterium]
MAVVNWIKSGKLAAYTTPGGHRRVPIAHFRAFLQAHRMPPLVEEVPAKRKILIVDDDPAVAAVTAKLLRRTNRYELVTAGNGFAAGIQVMTFAPDLVILDLMMPQLDGFQVCEMIKSTPETAYIKVLVLTGYHNPENEQKALDCGANACMGKPGIGDALQEKVAELLESVQ